MSEPIISTSVLGELIAALTAENAALTARLEALPKTIADALCRDLCDGGCCITEHGRYLCGDDIRALVERAAKETK